MLETIFKLKIEIKQIELINQKVNKFFNIIGFILFVFIEIHFNLRWLVLQFYIVELFDMLKEAIYDKFTH
jgi:hypothetical protein